MGLVSLDQLFDSHHLYYLCKFEHKRTSLILLILKAIGKLLTFIKADLHYAFLKL